MGTDEVPSRAGEKILVLSLVFFSIYEIGRREGKCFDSSELENTLEKSIVSLIPWRTRCTRLCEVQYMLQCSYK